MEPEYSVSSQPVVDTADPVSTPPPVNIPSAEEAFQLTVSLPPGFLFQPTDEQTLFYYLKGKVLSQEVTGAIADLDIYMYDPWDVAGKSKLKSTTEWYFYTNLQSRYKSGPRTKRDTPHGRWRRQGRMRKEFKDSNTDLKGTKMTYAFFLKNGTKEEPSEWRMEEFKLENHSQMSISKVFRKKKEMVEQTNVQDSPSDEDSSSDDEAATNLLMIPQPQL
ncbi:unnamed protein product [Eruca vesicaria subsp. sativa]|uniref:NAC domain-containing protein n=1 Tax=Eruca vesicaria subsp. sativa TaxID=29727 RepID=A0ABC8M651_ERUVS|nr:unnamed protein product [Eruca vesicaria subsp. sativa]